LRLPGRLSGSGMAHRVRSSPNAQGKKTRKKKSGERSSNVLEKEYIRSKGREGPTLGEKTAQKAVEQQKGQVLSRGSHKRFHPSGWRTTTGKLHPVRKDRGGVVGTIVLSKI